MLPSHLYDVCHELSWCTDRGTDFLDLTTMFRLHESPLLNLTPDHPPVDPSNDDTAFLSQIQPGQINS